VAEDATDASARASRAEVTEAKDFKVEEEVVVVVVLVVDVTKGGEEPSVFPRERQAKKSEEGVTRTEILLLISFTQRF